MHSIPSEEVHDLKGHEFVAGEWHEKQGGFECSLVAGNLLTELKQYARSQKLGTVHGSGCGFQFFQHDPRQVRKPNVSFVRKGRFPDGKLPDGNVCFPPDFCAEVISPTDKAEEVFDKLDQYLINGVQLVWAIYPLTRCVWILRPNGSDSRIKQGSVSGEEVIPGFSILLDNLFADL